MHARTCDITNSLQGPHRFSSLRWPKTFFDINSRTASTSIVSRAMMRSLRRLFELLERSQIARFKSGVQFFEDRNDLCLAERLFFT